mgnify:CR=1 FL=1
MEFIFIRIIKQEMKTIQQAMIEEIYESALKISHKGKQAIYDEKDKNDGSYYITLLQLENILKVFES